MTSLLSSQHSTETEKKGEGGRRKKRIEVGTEREREREGRERTSERAVSIHPAGEVCMLPASRELWDRRSCTGRAPVMTGSQARGEWTLGQEVQNPRQGCSRDLGDRLDQ